MKKTFLLMLTAIAAMTALLLPLTGASAQEPRAPVPNATAFMISEFADKPVKGAPYSAQAITETRQRLADGNEIVNKSETTVYRDTQGRTRREQNLKTIGGLAGAPAVQLITISDPVAGASYTLDPVARTARKSAFNSFFIGGSGGTSPSISVNGGGSGAVTFSRTEGAAGGTGTGYTFSTSTGGPVTTSGDRVTLLKQGLDNVKREDLGTQTIEGVEAAGTRNTITIPAGEIGNERPIDIVTERWYSKELQTTVMSRRSDPRSGETIFRLTNINRSEPAGSLFEIPGDYKVTEAGGALMRTRQ
jgi:hypothetical protein